MLLVTMIQRWHKSMTVLMTEQIYAAERSKTIMMAATALMTREGGVLLTTMMAKI